MSDQTAPKVYKDYTSTYHSYHRNTLIASLLLIMVSFPKVEIDLSSITFVKKAPFLQEHLPLVVFCAAFYCLGIFISEWWLQSLSDYRNINSTFDAMIERGNNIATDINNQSMAADQHRALVTDRIKENAESLLTGVPPQFDNLIGEWLGMQNYTFEEIRGGLSRFIIKSGIDSEFSRSFIEELNRQIESHSHDARRGPLTATISHHYHEQINVRANELMKANDELGILEANIQKACKDFRNVLGNGHASHAKAMLPLTTKTWVFGIAIPVIAFVTGTVMFLGPKVLSIFA